MVYPPPNNDPPCNVLVVCGHPNSTDSFSSEICRQAVKGLLKYGNNVKIVCVSDGSCDPLLRGDELSKRTIGFAKSDWILCQLELLMWCDKIVWIYPTWWSSVPAGVKGWIDRVFIEGCAFSTETPYGAHLKPLLKIKKTAIITTWGGSRWQGMYTGDLGKRLLSRCIPAACYVDRAATTLHLKLHNVDDSLTRRQAFLREVETRMSLFYTC